MSRVESLFADYASYHRTPGNKTCHRFGIPLIVLSGLGMLARVHLWTASVSYDFIPGTHITGIDAAMLLMALAEIYYLAIEWRLGLAMLVAVVVLYWIGVLLPFWADAVLFTAGWILQFIGHARYEHQKPAFLKNVLHLLVGPLWILNDLVPVVKWRLVSAEP